MNPLSIRYVKAALLAAAAAGLGTLALAYTSTHPRRRRLRKRPEELEHREVGFPSRDGLRLSGWLIPADEAQAVIVLCHGFPNNRSEMLPWARILHAAGFAVLMFDFRALGESEGKLCTIGAHEVLDLQGALDFLGAESKTREKKIGVFGLSMGGAVALMTAAQDDRIEAVAAHGAYATLDSAIAQRCRMVLGPLGKPIERMTKWWARKWVPTDPMEISPESVVAAIAPRPVLLFHGLRDRIIHPDDATRIHTQARDPKRLIALPRSYHVRVHPLEKPGYDDELLTFFRTHLNVD
jgi:dipeptidyl aminopeptidase/acylaminoacyl peptidase